MQLNPIFALELRARWRMNRSFLLLLGVALALSALAIFVYQSVGLQSDFRAGAPSSSGVLQSFNRGASAVGRQLFVALANANILSWLLLGVASAATGIARERERGLLESLQLSPMSARGQIAARFGAGVLLPGVLQLVLLPVYGVAILMGGVSVAEVAGAIAIATGAAILGTSIGLWFSARSHRPTSALFGSLLAVVLVSVGVYLWITNSLFWSARAFAALNWDALWPALLHPSALFWALSDPAPKWSFSPLQMVVGAGAFWLLISGILLELAARGVNRTLPVAAWQGRARWVEKLRQKQTAAPQSKRSGRAGNSLLADLPLDRFVKFSDPLLAREVKSRFRLRRAGVWLSLVRGALFVGAISVWLFEVFWLFDAPSRDQMAPYGLRALLYGGTLCLAVLSATSWTHERESGTWESLKLSLLTPRQILRAKWLSPLVSFAYYSAPLWILLPLGALFIRFPAFVAGVLVVAAWLGLAVALGLWMSWRVRNGTAAIAWTVGVLTMLLVGAPWLNTLAHIDDALARAKYGVGNAGEAYDVIYSPVGATKPRIVELYERETGAQAIQNYSTASGFVNYSYTQQMQEWVQEKISKSEDFKRKLNAWHPGEALNRLFVERDPTDSPYYWSQNRTPDDATSAVLCSTLAPLVLTLILLALLRRDVKREQVG